MTPLFPDFFIEEVVLDDVRVGDKDFTIHYRLDGQPIELGILYHSIDFAQPPIDGDMDMLKRFAVSIGVLSFLRFGALLPKRFDVTKHSRWIHPFLLDFLRRNTYLCWSEHRYQVDRMDYRGPEIVADHGVLGDEAKDVFRGLAPSDTPKVIVASGSGKDSLLCAKLIEEANLSYDLVTYLDTLYGDASEQDQIFSRLSKELAYENLHLITIDNNFNDWLLARLDQFQVREQLRAKGITKPFRYEAGETFSIPLVFALVQLVHNLPAVIVGYEKSADFPNLIHKSTGDEVAHQWAKTHQAEMENHALLSTLLEGIQTVSVTKPIHDVKIFSKLFEIKDDLPYLTNSCNHKKPWCCSCEKCAYVFSGFAAFGDHDKTVAAFGEDLFQKESLLHIWSELLGLKGYIAWECVGHPEETQLYFYKAYKTGITGPAIELFQDKILEPLRQKGVDLDQHFVTLEEKYMKVHSEHHHMPSWLWQRIQPILMSTESLNAVESFAMA